jgi:DNA replication and repair protein RecF
VNLNVLTVRNFRNIAALDLTLPEAGAVIIGENGHGKTNFLEAIYYMVLFRSLRNAKDRELVRFGEAGFFVAGEAAHRITAGYEVAGTRKKVTVDGRKIDRLGDAVGTFLAVAFAPSDRAMVSGGPSGRRRYLDVVLSLCQQGYLRELVATRAALKQRNAALRRGHHAAARAFDGPLAESALRIGRARREWVEEWHGRFEAICRHLGESLPVVMRYQSRGWDVEGTVDGVLQAFDDASARDMRRGVTTVGPHRDDLRLLLGDRNLRTYGSAGQQRTAAIGLRILEAETLASARSGPPVALYDDVFAELDQNRQARLLEMIAQSLGGQAIVAAPRDSEVPPGMLDRPRWTMAGGRLVPE